MAVNRPKPIRRYGGFSLVEVLVSMTIGLVILLGVISMLATSSKSQRDLDQSSNIMENGFFAINLLFEDLRLAGFYGHYYFNALAVPAALPDPCIINDAATLEAGMALPVQGYNATNITTRANVTATTCFTWFLADANVQPGSDILVVRRADTAVFTGTPVEDNDVYLQSNVLTAAIQYGSTSANVPTTQVDGAAPTFFKRNGAAISPADTRRYHLAIYFVAPCSVGTGTNGVCTGSDDTIPTLKQLELTSVSGVTSLVITPLAEGVEYMKLLYGIDTTPATVNAATGLVGDGEPDTYIAAPVLAQWSSVTSVQVHLLVRAPQVTSNHVDDKSYQLAGITIPAINDGFRRHVFSSEVRLVNLSGPRSLL